MISLINRTFNNEDLNEKAIKSALNQNFKNYEIVVINDGSTDNTKNILDNLSLNNKKLKVIHQENQGMIEAGYSGLKHSKGDYVIFLDGDDEYKNDALSELFSVLEKDPEKAFAYCDYCEIDLRTGAMKIVYCDNIFNVMVCGVLFKKSVLDEVGFWDKDLIFAEHDLLIRIMNKYDRVYVKKPLYFYNRHDNAFTANKDKVKEGKKQLFDKYGFIKNFKEY